MKRNSLIFSIIITSIITHLVTLFLYTHVDIPFINTCNNKIHQVEEIIDSSYVGEFDRKKAEESAIKALLYSTGDKYAEFYDEEASKELLQTIEGNYCGIGVEVTPNIEENLIEILSIQSGGPAEKTGIKAGDRIISVDSINYDATQLAEISLSLKCSEEELKKKPEVTICVKRGSEIKNFTVKREKIDYYKITSFIKDKILYIRYKGISQNSYKEFKTLFKNTDESAIEGIIVDLRDNPGGELNSSIKMCDLFLDDGLIMYTLDKYGNKKEYFADKYSFDTPMVVLVNDKTASAAEIFAGSMKGRNRAQIVGQKTFGKGVSQSIIEINGSDEGAVKITTKKNFTPDGTWINDSIIPDVYVEDKADFTNIEKDKAYLTAVKILKQ